MEARPQVAPRAESDAGGTFPGAHGTALAETVERAPVGIAHFDASGKFLYANPQLATIFGLSREQVLACTFQEISFPGDLPRCLALTAQLATGAIPRYTLEKRFVRPGGSHVYVRVIVTVVRGATHRDDYFLGIVEDLSEQWAAEQARLAAEAERERLLEAERLARAAAEKAITLREEVLAIVAHDLRNPVHTIMMSAGAMIELPLTVHEHAQQLALIRRAAGGMDRLIRDLLDVAQIETGRLAIHPEPVDLAAIIAEAVAAHEARAAERSLALVVAAVPAPLPVLADRIRMTQVLGNLLANSLKFTPPGGTISVHVATAGGQVTVAVADTGRGIAPDHLPRVFDAYWQAESGVRQGVGLGLAIVRGIVEAHGGTVGVTSQPGTGTTVTLSLPLARS